MDAFDVSNTETSQIPPLKADVLFKITCNESDIYNDLLKHLKKESQYISEFSYVQCLSAEKNIFNFLEKINLTTQKENEISISSDDFLQIYKNLTTLERYEYTHKRFFSQKKQKLYSSKIRLKIEKVKEHLLEKLLENLERDEKDNEFNIKSIYIESNQKEEDTTNETPHKKWLKKFNFGILVAGGVLLATIKGENGVVAILSLLGLGKLAIGLVGLASAFLANFVYFSFDYKNIGRKLDASLVDVKSLVSTYVNQMKLLSKIYTHLRKATYNDCNKYYYSLVNKLCDPHFAGVPDLSNKYEPYNRVLETVYEDIQYKRKKCLNVINYKSLGKSIAKYSVQSAGALMTILGTIFGVKSFAFWILGVSSIAGIAALPAGIPILIGLGIVLTLTIYASLMAYKYFSCEKMGQLVDQVAGFSPENIRSFNGNQLNNDHERYLKSNNDLDRRKSEFEKPLINNDDRLPRRKSESDIMLPKNHEIGGNLRKSDEFMLLKDSEDGKLYIVNRSTHEITHFFKPQPYHRNDSCDDFMNGIKQIDEENPAPVTGPQGTMMPYQN